MSSNFFKNESVGHFTEISVQKKKLNSLFLILKFKKKNFIPKDLA